MIRTVLKRAAVKAPLLLLAVAANGFIAGAAFAGNGQAQVGSSDHGSLPSLRGAAYRPDDFAKSAHAHPLHPLPMIDGAGNQTDAAVQGSAPANTAPVLGSGVPGLGVGFTGPAGSFQVQYAPPDTSGAVGATQYVQVVNTGLAVFDKTTKNVVLGPIPTNALWQGMGGRCASDNDGDAVVVYDKTANRWVVSQFAVTTTPYYQCVAVSKTSDATGGWWTYAFNYGSVFPDYPKIGVWPDAYYITFNMFTNTFQGAKLCAYDRAKMLTGAAATQQCFQLSTSYGGVLPADLDGATAPPAGAPNYMLNFGASSLNLWKFHVNWTTPTSTTLTGPINIPVATFAAACGGGTCVPQPGVSQKLDSLGDRLMYRLTYRNFTNHESLVVTHSVKVGTKHNNAYTGIRWYEIRSPGTTPVVYQQSTYSPDTTFRWMGSAAMDKQGNLAVGYNASSSSVFPSIRYTGRLATDPLNTLQAEASILNGLGSQTGQNLNRWGDYSTLTLDPSDDCTFWYSTEYLRTNGAFNWSTQIASFKFPGCQ
jgi:hypothetical protein